MENDQIWEAVLGELELTLSKANFTTWFKNTKIVSNKDGEFVVGVPNHFTREWLQGKYNKNIARALQNTINNRVKKISYELVSKKSCNNNIFNEGEKKEKTSAPVFNFAPINQKTNIVTNNPSATGLLDFNPKYTFENYVVGKNNELARAAAVAVKDDPGVNYNPLFIYGGVGLGKTHLMQAIGNEILKSDKSKKIVYVTCETFIDDFIKFIHKEKGKDYESTFKERYRNADFLLIDDIQFLGGKEGTQEEFFHTFNALYQKNKQIVLTSDRPPKAIPELEDRLVSRFEGGMVADIGMPDMETRKAILVSKCRERNLKMPEEVLTYISHNIQNNIRELEGALSKIIAHCQLKNEIPSEGIAKSVLSSMVTNPGKMALTSDRIISTITAFYNIKKHELLAKSRKKEVAWPRQIAMYLMRNEGKISYPTIGSELGGRDHTTAIHACDKVSKEIESNDNIRQEIEAIRQQLLQAPLSK
ncbi:MAG: chromosomal replication initiator protein DnaA [Parcubacteria group bacterium]|nr:chromosomal replication initiator protein DnaA [Parcubacteria group bacterium]